MFAARTRTAWSFLLIAVTSVLLLTPPPSWAVTVAVIGSGIDYTREEFGNCATAQSCPKIVRAIDYTNSGDVRETADTRATIIASIIAGNITANQPGGIDPNAKLAVYKVCNPSCGSPVDAINDAAAQRYDIIIPFFSSSGSSSPAVLTALANAATAGSVIVAPVLNVSSSFAPQGAEDAITVGESTSVWAQSYRTSPVQDTNKGYWFTKPELMLTQSVGCGPAVTDPNTGQENSSVVNFWLSYTYGGTGIPYLTRCTLPGYPSSYLQQNDSLIAMAQIGGRVAALFEGNPTWKRDMCGPTPTKFLPEAEGSRVSQTYTQCSSNY